MKIETIHNVILQSYSYVLYEDGVKDCYLIDCGEVEPIKRFLHANGKDLKGILLTHSHYDHIYGINEILNLYPDVIIYASAGTIEGLSNVGINLSYMYDDGDYIVNRGNTIDVYSTTISLFNNTLNPISTPGHDSDCTTYIIGCNIFTGDAYNPNFDVFTKWRRSNPIEAQKSIDSILQLVKLHNLTIYPGHYK